MCETVKPERFRRVDRWEDFLEEVALDEP